MDLHIHSSCSDGLVSPTGIARQAIQAGLSCISLTDHNTVVGLRELRSCLEGSSVELIDGVELCANSEDATEIHILGYGVSPQDAGLLETLLRVASLKRVQMARMVEGLQQQGVDVRVEDIPGGLEAEYVGRPMLAHVLMQKGVVRTTREAFDRYLGSGGSVYVPLGALSPEECMQVIHNAGGLAVFGHPTIELLDAYVVKLAHVGLDGLEVYRPSIGGNKELYAEMVAQDFGLFVTGGSDWHGRAAEGPLGGFSVPGEKLSGFSERIHARGSK